MRKPSTIKGRESNFGQAGDSALAPLVVLLAQHDDTKASELKQAFEDIACDWRFVRVVDGRAAARYVMTNSLPNLLLTCPDLPGITACELIAWARSFNCTHPFEVVVHGKPQTMEIREELLRQEVKVILDGNNSRSALLEKLSQLVSQIEKQRYNRI